MSSTKNNKGGNGGFKETFASAKQSGKKTFKWRGKSYNTKTKDEAMREGAKGFSSGAIMGSPKKSGMEKAATGAISGAAMSSKKK